MPRILGLVFKTICSVIHIIFYPKHRKPPQNLDPFVFKSKCQLVEVHIIEYPCHIF